MSTSENVSSNSIRWIVAITIGLVIGGCYAIFGGEREGTVEYDDCKEKIYLKSDNDKRLFNKFTCEYSKTKSGKIMGGVCMHVDYFDNNECKSVYIYEKEPDSVCPETSPYLDYDDKCYPDKAFGRVEAFEKP